MKETATKHLDDEARREESSLQERGAFDLGGAARAGARTTIAALPQGDLS